MPKFSRPSCADRLLKRDALEASEVRDIGGWLRRSPAWSIAIAAHALAAVILMNIVTFIIRPAAEQVFRISLKAPRLPAPATPGKPDAKPDNDPEPAAAAAVVAAEEPSAELPTVDNLPVVAPAAPTLQLPTGITTAGADGTARVASVYLGRGKGGRGEQLERWGGGDDTEGAVGRGLDWLARHQGKLGQWGEANAKDLCVRSEQGETLAMTGLALLAFLGHGELPDTDSQHAKTVARARDWIVRCQRKDGSFVDRSDRAQMYSHAIATFAIAEAFAVTQDQELRLPLTRALDFIESAESSSGGWGYDDIKSSRSDLSVSTWVVQAIRAARLGGVPIKRALWNKVRKYYVSVRCTAPAGFSYEYHGGNSGKDGGSASMAAAGGLSSHYLDIDLEESFEVELTARILTDQMVYDKSRDRNVYAYAHYYTYYATLWMFQRGGKDWKDWNTRLKACLLPMQEQKGCEAGSWSPSGNDGESVGRAYSTALSILDLEVYYRYAPGAQQEPIVDLTDDPGTTQKDLLDSLVKGNMTDRYRAVKELIQRGEPSSVGPILEAARIEKSSLKAVLIEALASFPRDAATNETLKGWMLDESLDQRIRQAAKKVLDSPPIGGKKPLGGVKGDGK